MDVNRTKCDQCDKEHDGERYDQIKQRNYELIYLRVPVKGGARSYDFCNLECLEQFLSGYKQKVAEWELEKAA